MISSISSGSPPGMAAMAAQRSQKFSQADGDASGGLNATEFQNLVAQGPGKPASDTSSVEADFKAFDSDADGSLTQAELEAGFEQKMLAFRSTVATYGGEAADGGTHVEAAQGAGGPEGTHGPGGPHGPPPGPPPTEESSDSSTETEEEDPLQTLLAALQASVDEAGTTGTTGSADSSTRVANELRELLRGLMAEAAGSTGSASASGAISLTA